MHGLSLRALIVPVVVLTCLHYRNHVQHLVAVAKKRLYKLGTKKRKLNRLDLFDVIDKKNLIDKFRKILKKLSQIP